MVGKIEPEVSGFKLFFFFFLDGALKSPTAVKTRLDKMEKTKGRDIAFVSD